MNTRGFRYQFFSSLASALIAMPSLASAVSSSCEYTGPPASSRGSVAGQVRVMTMNVYGQNDDSELRCQARLKFIGEKLANQRPLFDVIGLTEVHPDYPGYTCDGEKLVKGLRSTGEYGKNQARWGHPETPYYPNDGGTSIFATSEFDWKPYRDHVERYSPEYKTRTAHGFVFARIPIVREIVKPDGSVATDRRAGMVDVYVTHLYSKGDGSTACDQQCRYGQLQQLARGIHERSANSGNPVLVMGDFNIGGPNPTAGQCNGNPGYGDIMEVLRNPRDVWLEAHPNKSGTTHVGKTRQRIDYIFVLTDPYFTNSTRQLVLRNPEQVRLIDWEMPGYHAPPTNFSSGGPRWIEGPFDVSDHIGIEATFEVHHSAKSGEPHWREPGQDVPNEVVEARRGTPPRATELAPTSAGAQCSAAATSQCTSRGASCDVIHDRGGNAKEVCRWSSRSSESACQRTAGIWTPTNSKYAQNHPDAIRTGGKGACITEVTNILRK